MNEFFIMDLTTGGYLDDDCLMWVYDKEHASIYIKEGDEYWSPASGKMELPKNAEWVPVDTVNSEIKAKKDASQDVYSRILEQEDYGIEQAIKTMKEKNLDHPISFKTDSWHNKNED